MAALLEKLVYGTISVISYEKKFYWKMYEEKYFSIAWLDQAHHFVE